MPRLPNPMQPLTEEDSEYFCSVFLSSHNSLTIQTEFCEFYANILRRLYPKFRSNYGLICEALHSVRKYIVPGIPAPLPDYEDSNFRFAYLFTYCIVHSVVMYDRFRDILEVNPTMLMRIQTMNELNLCILGGGPGFEAGTVCKLLSKAKAVFKSCSKSQLRIHVTIIDLYAEWETISECLFTNLQKELHPLIKVDFCYVQANLTKELSPAVIEAIKSAHIVTMFKFVFEVCNRYGCKNVEKMLKGIVENMSFKSCLFFLDNAGGGYFKIVDEMIDHNTCMERIYGPIFHHCQELNEKTVEKYSSLVQDRFRTLQCTGRTTVSCSAWLKIRHPSKKALEKFDLKKSKRCYKEEKSKKIVD